MPAVAGNWLTGTDGSTALSPEPSTSFAPSGDQILNYKVPAYLKPFMGPAHRNFEHVIGKSDANKLSYAWEELYSFASNHSLKFVSANGQRESWHNARKLWRRYTSTAWPGINIGIIWGIGAFRFSIGEENKNKTTDSERFGTMASLAIWSTWKARNERAMSPDRLTNTDTASSIFKDVLKDVIRKSWISTSLEPENRRQKREERLQALWENNPLAVLERGKPPKFGF